MQLIIKRPLGTSILLLVMLVMTRWMVGHNDFSYFVVAGDVFVDTAQMEVPIHTEVGPGYDGQFFYRYALNPFSTKQEAYGIHLDHPAYRHQRIIYPLLAWFLSVGQAEFVPIALVLINILAFLGIVFMFMRFCISLGIQKSYALLPLLFSGLWMSLGRDLAEPTECFFIVAAIYFFYRKTISLYVVSATLAVLTREPSAIILLPISVMWLFNLFKSNAFKVNGWIIYIGLLLALPFMALLTWKIGLQHWHQSAELVEGSNNIGLPFYGLYQGFWEGMHQLTDLYSWIEFGLWLSFICWNGWLIGIVIRGKALTFDPGQHFQFTLTISWIASLIMASLYTYSIYVDDWAFLRVLSGFNVLSALLIIHQKTRLPKSFILASILLLASTLLRLIVRI